MTPRIITRRFILRPVEQGDAPAFARLCDDEAIARNTARIPRPYTLDDARGFVAAIAEAFRAGTEYAFAVCENGALIACCGVTAKSAGAYELGYWVGAASRGHGVATEAAAGAAHFAFAHLGAGVLEAGHFTDNPASGRVLRKLGFRPTGETVMTFSLGRGGEAETRRMELARKAFRPPCAIRITVPA